MTTSINEHTKDRMVTKPATKEYETNWDLIFKKDKENHPEEEKEVKHETL